MLLRQVVDRRYLQINYIYKRKGRITKVLFFPFFHFLARIIKINLTNQTRAPALATASYQHSEVATTRSGYQKHCSSTQIDWIYQLNRLNYLPTGYAINIRFQTLAINFEHAASSGVLNFNCSVREHLSNNEWTIPPRP